VFRQIAAKKEDFSIAGGNKKVPGTNHGSLPGSALHGNKSWLLNRNFEFCSHLLGGNYIAKKYTRPAMGAFFRLLTIGNRRKHQIQVQPQSKSGRPGTPVDPWLLETLADFKTSLLWDFALLL
jgi:hypothetical protein